MPNPAARAQTPPLSEIRRKYDPEFKAGAVRIVREARRPVAEIARELGIGAGTLGNWVHKDRGEAEGLTADERYELVRLLAELRSKRCGDWDADDRALTAQAPDGYDWGRRDSNNDGVPCE